MEQAYIKILSIVTRFATIDATSQTVDKKLTRKRAATRHIRAIIDCLHITIMLLSATEASVSTIRIVHLGPVM